MRSQMLCHSSSEIFSTGATLNQVVMGPSSRALTNKLIILFTHGMWNDGRNPRLTAQDAKAAGINVHTISILTQQQSDLEEVAKIIGEHAAIHG